MVNDDFIEKYLTEGHTLCMQEVYNECLRRQQHLKPHLNSLLDPEKIQS